MKAENKTTYIGFKPLIIELRFTSQQEVDTFAKMCNYAPLCSWAQNNGLDLEDILGVIEESHKCDTGIRDLSLFVKDWVRNNS
jgi:hypothetical protein